MSASPALAAASERLRRKPGRPRKATAEVPVEGAAAGPTSRLLDVDAAARYLSISPWSLRDMIASGLLHRVRLPLGGNRELRRVLVDVQDLDKLIACAKERPA